MPDFGEMADKAKDFAGDHDMRVLGCDIHDSVSIGVQFKGGAYNCLAEGNRIHDVADSAIQLGEATGAEFYLPGYTDWEAQASIAQVLVFKFRNERASFKADSAKVSIDSASLRDLLPARRRRSGFVPFVSPRKAPYPLRGRIRPTRRRFADSSSLSRCSP